MSHIPPGPCKNNPTKVGLEIMSNLFQKRPNSSILFMLSSTFTVFLLNHPTIFQVTWRFMFLTKYVYTFPNMKASANPAIIARPTLLAPPCS